MPEPGKPDPLWRQIAQDLLQRIETGQIGANGEPLPTDSDLQSQYGAARNTVRTAIGWLRTRGLVTTGSGQRTYVAAKIDPFVTTLDRYRGAGPGAERYSYASSAAAQHRQPHESDVEVQVKRAAGIPAAQLELPANALIISRHQDRFLDGLPYSRRTSYYPMSLVERGAGRLLEDVSIDEGVVTYLREVLQVTEAGWIDVFSVRVPDAAESSFFKLPDDGRVAIIDWFRTGYDQSGKPFRVTITTAAADRNVFMVPSGEIPEKYLSATLQVPADQVPAELAGTELS